MNVVRNNVETLVVEELKAANEKFPLFHSAHEGYAVMLERVEELKEKVTEIEREMSALWRFIKENKVDGSRANAVIERAERSIGTRATLAAVEAIQVAAMCKKFKMSLETDNIGNPKMLERADMPIANDVFQPVLQPAAPENFELMHS